MNDMLFDPGQIPAGSRKGRFSPTLSVITSVYRGAVYLPAFISNLEMQSCFSGLEVIFILNQPDSLEQRLVLDFQNRCPDQVRVISLPAVESVGASWNRALEFARADYLAVWNVDDAREPDSLRRQIEALENSPHAAMAYGDFKVVPSFGSRAGEIWPTPEFRRFFFSRSLPQGGAFLVWRRSLLKSLIGFDEQLTSAPDFDFSLRVVLNGHRMLRVPGLMGYFLNEGKGLSTREGSRRTAVEGNLLYLRYAVYDRVRRELMPESQSYRVEHLLISGEWRALSSLYPWYTPRVSSRQYLWKVNTIRLALVSMLKKLRLYNALNRIRQLLFHIDI